MSSLSGEDKMVMVWDADTLEVKKVFRGHRGSVTALCFRRNDTSLLISGSKDRYSSLGQGPGGGGGGVLWVQMSLSVWLIEGV